MQPTSLGQGNAPLTLSPDALLRAKHGGAVVVQSILPLASWVELFGIL